MTTATKATSGRVAKDSVPKRLKLTLDQLTPELLDRVVWATTGGSGAYEVVFVADNAEEARGFAEGFNCRSEWDCLDTDVATAGVQPLLDQIGNKEIHHQRGYIPGSVWAAARAMTAEAERKARRKAQRKRGVA
jgi:hypothetical protein